MAATGGFDRYFEERMRDLEFADAYRTARAEVDELNACDVDLWWCLYRRSLLAGRPCPEHEADLGVAWCRLRDAEFRSYTG